ncbi:hypothetical protein NEOC84_001653|nr:hypothetical protein [Neochlamydia sp. AcF84]
MYKMQEYLKKFFEFYSRGDLVAAVSQIIYSPEPSYDTLQPANEWVKQVINFVDAAVFGKSLEARYQLLLIDNLRKSHPHLYEKEINDLKVEESFLLFLLSFACQEKEHSSLGKNAPPFLEKIFQAEQGKIPLSPEAIKEILGLVPNNFKTLFEFHLRMAAGWQNLLQRKSSYLSSLNCQYGEAHPWYPLQYSLFPPSLEDVPLDRIAVIFFEPLKEDFTGFLEKFKERPAVFAFTSLAIFFQMLQFPAFVQAAGEAHHLIYILEFYPHAQISSQNFKDFLGKEFYPIFFIPTSHLRVYAPALMQALQACFLQPYSEFNVDTPLGNGLYEIAKRLLFSIQQDRLGFSRLPALHMREGQLRWHDTHKGLPSSSQSLGPEVQDKMQILLSDLAKKRAVRARLAKDKIKVAHIVPQIAYGGHAPTRLLQNLVLHHDSSKMELLVISTEILAENLLEYPHNFYTSSSSLQRGRALICQFQTLGVSTLIHENPATYLHRAHHLSSLLKEAKIDVAVFHGPDTVNTLATQMVDVPLRVLLEHGSQPTYPGFDLAIVSTDTAVEIYQDLYKKIHTQVVALPFALDVRKNWLPQPYEKKSLGLPEDCLVMTTISTKLDTRLTAELCYAIAEILQKVPQAVYAPIGAISNLGRIKKIFKEYGVDNRFYYLGPLANPSQYARSMHLYLNEFPVGSCLAILDAMASGCPVVTMFDVNGPQQARYGGIFMGIDRAVHTGKKEEYIQLACHLLTNPATYKEWSYHAKKQYEQFADVKGYVKSFEEIIFKAYGEF